MAILRFLRLIDQDEQLSLTNIAVIAILVKLLIQPAIDSMSMAALIGTLFSYQSKRFLNGLNSKKDSEN